MPASASIVPLRGVDVAQGLEGPPVARVGVEDRLVGLDRLRGVAEARPEHEPELVVQPRDLAPVHGRLHPQAEVLGEVGPALEPLVQVLERRERLVVPRPGREQLLPERDRLVEPAELGGERRHPREHPLLRRRVRRGGALRGEVPEQVLAAPGRLVERLQGAQRRHVARIDLRGRLVRLGGAVGRGEPLLAELPEPEQDLDLLRRRPPARRAATRTSASSGQDSSRP